MNQLKTTLQEKIRRTVAIILFAVLLSLIGLHNSAPSPPTDDGHGVKSAPQGAVNALSALDKLAVKGRAPKTAYSRDQFISDWGEINNCDMRNLILQRDLTAAFIDPISHCLVVRGHLEDPYTGKMIDFKRGELTSGEVQIDHVVALSDAWQTGAQQLSPAQRNNFGNDPLNLLAVDGPTNQKKGDGDAATWLPPNKAYRCRYVARQIAVKLKYGLWITVAEKDAIIRQLKLCPDQVLPIESPA